MYLKETGASAILGPVLGFLGKNYSILGRGTSLLWEMPIDQKSHSDSGYAFKVHSLARGRWRLEVLGC